MVPKRIHARDLVNLILFRVDYGLVARSILSEGDEEENL